jgi:Toprim-like
MTNFLNAADIKEQVSLVDLLTRLGYNAQRRSGKERMYLSMLRDSDTKPSFTVNDDLNVWYDHGAGKGGNIIDFALAYWPGLEFADVLDKIRITCQQEIIPLKADAERTSRRRHAVKIPHFKVEEVKELGNNPAITAYLQSRCVWNAAQGKLKEVYYYVKDEKQVRKSFFAAGWQNEFGSWEVRNKYFKSCIGQKGITFYAGDPGRLAVFEGYLDYLSWTMNMPDDGSSVLVLNSLSLLELAIWKANSFPEVGLFFDRDKAGQGASLIFKAACPQAIDRSVCYEGFKDYNDKITSEILSNKVVSFQPDSGQFAQAAFAR